MDRRLSLALSVALVLIVGAAIAILWQARLLDRAPNLGLAVVGGGIVATRFVLSLSALLRR